LPNIKKVAMVLPPLAGFTPPVDARELPLAPDMTLAKLMIRRKAGKVQSLWLASVACEWA